MALAELTFAQEIGKGLIEAFAAALFVTIGGYLAADRWGRSRERASQEFSLRTQLAERATASASGMFIACQHARRALKAQRVASAAGSTGSPDDATINALDDAYHSFAVESKTIETLIGARYGTVWNLPDPDNKEHGRAFVRWHQIKDLLTLYYFNVRGAFPGEALASNSRDFEGRFHSGIDAVRYFKDPGNPQPPELGAMRKDIRRTYNDALTELVGGLLGDPVGSGPVSVADRGRRSR
jgi:hypothetical protein